MTDEQQQDYSLFEDTPNTELVNTKNSKYTFTPGRFERLVIDSQKNSNSRFKTFDPDLPMASNLNERLFLSAIEDKQERQSSNLDMVIGTDRISLSKDNFCFSDEEESDEGDLLSSGLFTQYSPEPSFEKTKQPTIMNFFDDDEFEEVEEDVKEEPYDPSNSWLSRIYYQNTDIEPTINFEQDEFISNNNDDENKPPPNYQEKTMNHPKTNRIPLQEIEIRQSVDNDDNPTSKKKLILTSSGKSKQLRLMRALSPPRYSTKNKDHIPSTTHSFTTTTPSI